MPQPRKAKPEPVDNTVHIKIEGKSYEIDPSDLSWGEVEGVEVYFGSSVDDVDWETGRGVMYLCYIARSRVEPTFTLSDMRKLRVSAFEMDTEARPTVSGDADTGTRS